MLKSFLSISATIALMSGVAIAGEDIFANKDTSIAYPTTDKEKREINVAKKFDLNGKKVDLSYKTILRTGDVLNGETFGLLKDENDKPIKLKDGSNYICNGQYGGSGPDHTEFLKVGDKIYMLTQFECQIGAEYLVELKQDKKSGELSPVDMKFVSQKDYHGGWVHCAGSKTPWNSFLGSEEYESDARKLNKDTGEIDKYYSFVAPYFGGDLKKSNPYYYSYITETKIDDKGNASYTKHYSMGRFAHELAYVMPDKKTVYLSDDGTNCAMFMFIADKEGDLSSGTLYSAKWKQTSNEGAGAANLEWIKLAHLNDSDLKKVVDSRVKFEDIFETAKVDESGKCPSGFTSINTSSGHECLKVKEGKENIAAALETRRFAAMKGATTEFRKMEGITYNPDNNKAYLAMSQIAKGMEDNKKKGKENSKYDKGGNNDIKLAYNKCGAVYELELGAKEGKYVANSIKAVVAGIPKKYDSNSTYAMNSCDINSISNPDNITYIPNSNTLMIGEDTGYHQTDLVWAFDTSSNKLKNRVASTPYGSETTSVMYQDINGFKYLNFVTQHPYGESDKDKVKSPSDVQSYVGYMQIGKK